MDGYRPLRYRKSKRVWGRRIRIVPKAAPELIEKLTDDQYHLLTQLSGYAEVIKEAKVEAARQIQGKNLQNVDKYHIMILMEREIIEIDEEVETQVANKIKEILGE